jgi:hypothetical protein
MFFHKWFFQGKCINIIDGQTILIWIDLGFNIWRRVRVRFNRIRMKAYAPDTENQSTEIANLINYLEQNLKGKQVYCQIYKKKDRIGLNKYFAEIFIQPENLSMRLVDINRDIANSHRIDGLVNFNNLLVGQGFSAYIQFNKKPVPAQNGKFSNP